MDQGFQIQRMEDKVWLDVRIKEQRSAFLEIIKQFGPKNGEMYTLRALTVPIPVNIGTGKFHEIFLYNPHGSAPHSGATLCNSGQIHCNADPRMEKCLPIPSVPLHYLFL